MLQYILVPLNALFLGLARGLLTCAVFCAPGLIPFVIDKKSTPRDALRIGILFNLPRVVLMTLFGALFGFLLYHLGSQDAMGAIILNLHIWAYLILGTFMVILGLRMFYSARKEAIENMKECKSCRVCRVRAKPKMRKGNALFVVWGSLLSIACLAEVFIIDGVIITAVGAFSISDAVVAVVVGAASMFMFAVGASIPIIGVLLASNKAGGLIKTQRYIRNAKVVFSVALVFIGVRIAWEYILLVAGMYL